MLLSKPRRLLVSVLIAMLFFSNEGYASDAKINMNDVQFNTSLLSIKDKNRIDLSDFSQAGYIMPGSYTFAIRINDQQGSLSDESINWVVPDNAPKESVPCLTSALVGKLGLKSGIASHLRWWHHNQCLRLSSLPGMTARGDLAKETLFLEIPLEDMAYQEPGWDPPSRWDNGITGALFDYYVAGQSTTSLSSSGGTNNTLSGNGTVGANWGPWRFRADWQADYDTAQGEKPVHHWVWSRYYAYRALPQIDASLTLGQNSLYSDIFDSFNFTGFSLVSDDDMLPPNLRGYAPEVTGVAKTNARVIISQQGRILEQTQVGAGPFRIDNLSNMISGTLDVRVEEQDGSVKTFTVNTDSVPYLTRPGQMRYKIAAGRPSDDQYHDDGPAFASGELSWGVDNGWSLYGGAIGSEDYNALSLGMGRDLEDFGAISLDATQSYARLPGGSGIRTGGSYRLSYSKDFNATDSEITFAGYRFSERHFMDMQDFLDARAGLLSGRRSKNMYTLSLNQQIPALKLSLYLDYSHQTYWDSPENDRYTFTLAHDFNLGLLQNLSLSFTAYKNNSLGMVDNGMYLSLSMPWGGNGSMSYSGTTAYGENTQQISYYNQMDNNNSYQMSVGETNGVATGSADWEQDTDFTHIDSNVSYQSGSYRTLGLSASGGLTLTSKGAAFSRIDRPGGTRLLIGTDGVAGIPLQGNGADTLTNRFGDAVITDIDSYTPNWVRVDLNKLPANAEVANTEVEATLTAGAIGYRKFNVVSGQKGMVTIRLADGSYPPFGATVEDSHHQDAGIISNEGNVYLSGMHKGERMSVMSEGGVYCTVQLPSLLPAETFQQGLLLPCYVAKKFTH